MCTTDTYQVFSQRQVEIRLNQVRFRYNSGRVQVADRYYTGRVQTVKVGSHLSHFSHQSKTFLHCQNRHYNKDIIFIYSEPFFASENHFDKND